MFKIFEYRNTIDQMVGMFQKEVAEEYAPAMELKIWDTFSFNQTFIM